ncbi:hypothetical protein quinque_016062 [Culex quinquefasciatus]
MVAPRDRKLLQLFHLRQINNATFITYVYPLLMLIRRLVYKRGFVKHRNSRIPKLRAAYKLQCVVDQINTGPGSKSVGKEDKQFEVTNFWRTTLRGVTVEGNARAMSKLQIEGETAFLDLGFPEKSDEQAPQLCWDAFPIAPGHNPVDNFCQKHPEVALFALVTARSARDHRKRPPWVAAMIKTMERWDKGVQKAGVEDRWENPAIATVTLPGILKRTVDIRENHRHERVKFGSEVEADPVDDIPEESRPTIGDPDASRRSLR